MAVASGASDSEELDRQLGSLLRRCSGDGSGADSELFCADFCKVVEEFASRWPVPLPQLRILEIALRHFSQASALFPTSCDHVHRTISSLALSLFELLLFFDQKEFSEEPLKQFTATFQECHSVLAKYENVILLQVERMLQDGGPWASPALQAILSEATLPQNEVDCYISSEPPVFLNLRVCYLSSCGRGSEAAALARRCARHPIAGQLLFFLRFYLSWLLKTGQHDLLHQEVAYINGKDAVHIICSLECEETDEILLELSFVFLSKQLQRGDMYCLCELVLVWTNLHRRLNTSKQTLLEVCHQLMQSATNVKSIFPFIRIILEEVGEVGVQFCVELCVNSLQSRLPCDVLTKTLIYKTIAGLLPSDLDVCRTCALLVFFIERSVESYKMVYLLYMHPDQEYHVDDSPIRNNIRFETLQILKKDLYFDPEFWNLIALRTNCLKLMSEKVVSAALEEIMEDKWISKYCTRGSALRSVCQRGTAAKKRHLKEDRFCKRDSRATSKRFRMDTEKMRLNSHALRRRGKQGSQALSESSSGPLRRSLWQLERIHGSLTLRYDEHRRTTRYSERNMPKRKIKKPKWLMEDSGALENVPLKMKRNGLKQQKLLRSCVMKRAQTGLLRNNTKLEPIINTRLKVKENNEYQNGLSLDSVKPANPPQIILELSLPDNELMDTFNDESSKRFSQVLLYKPTVKYPDASTPAKTGHSKEVILRARDTTMFVQLLHCYTRRQKGKGSGSNVHGSVSTITRSSAQGSPSKESDLCERPASEKGRERGSHVSEKLAKGRSTKEASESTTSPQAETCGSSPALTDGTTSMTDDFTQAPTVSLGKEVFEESAVEMKVTIASQASVLDKVSKSPTREDVAVVTNRKKSAEEIHPVSIHSNDSADSLLSQSRHVAHNRVEQEIQSLSSQEEGRKDFLREPCRNERSPGKNVNSASACGSPVKASPSENSTRMLAAEIVPEQAMEQFSDQEKDKGHEQHFSKSPRGKCRKTQSTSSSTVREQESSIGDVQVNAENTKAHDTRSETSENSELMEMAPETEESKLEHYCTFCSKFFMGARVVEHAMFHFRKDECTFCRTVFKDDLLAMMHLSDHIEKMKRLKAEENVDSTTKASAKGKATNGLPGHKEKPKKSADVNPSEPRTLRSNKKKMNETASNDKRMSKGVRGETTIHRVNGHIEKKDSKYKQESVQQQVSEERSCYRALQSKLHQKKQNKSEGSTSGHSNKKLRRSIKAIKKKEESLQLTDKIDVGENSHMELQEKVCCPAKRCSWFTKLSKNRVGLLYHVLDKHYGDNKPLELAFRVGNGKCSICMRVMWSFEHFQHHIERHRIAPRHPCPHRGCKARFKSGMEMRRHARKHSPLQALCCRPGCSQLFICLWALNLHEREHYTSKSTKSDSDVDAQSDDRPPETPDSKKIPSSEGTVRNSTFRLKQRAKYSSLRRNVAEAKRRLRVRNKSVESDVSEKETSAQPTTINLRLRQTLHKVKATNPAFRSQNVLSSALFKHKNKVKSRLKLKSIRIATRGRKRRMCPPRSSKNAAGQKTPSQDDGMPRVNTKGKAEKARPAQEKVRAGGSKVQIRRKERPSKSQSTSLNQSGVGRRKKTVDKRKLRKVEIHCVPSDSSKLQKNKISQDEMNKKAGKMHQRPTSESEAVKVTAVDDGSADEKARNQDSAQMESGSSVLDAQGPETIPSVSTAALSFVKPPTKDETFTKRLNKKGTVEAKEQDKQAKAKGAEGILKGLKRLIKNTIVEKEKRKEGPKNVTLATLPLSISTDTLAASTSKVPEENKQNTGNKPKTKSSKVKELDRSTATKRRKRINEDKTRKLAKKKRTEGNQSAAKSVKPLPGENGATDLPESDANTAGHSRTADEKLSSDDLASTPCTKTLAAYGKKPYLRLPPTAYLDEKYTAMPKRRKEMPFFQPSREGAPSKAAAQTQRCAKCFSTFNDAEELQDHNRLQKCSNLFGFDSDDEGNG